LGNQNELPADHRRATPVNVLIVEDEAEIRRTTARYLRHSGYQVKEARCGETAIEILKRAPLHVLITDQRLPGTLQGVDLLSYHRKVSSVGCRILFTAFFSDRLRRFCQYIGALYLEKPVPLDYLVRKIEHSLLARR
jgi:response regulator RpfG family c-di-GMP phosphodiesterase